MVDVEIETVTLMKNDISNLVDVHYIVDWETLITVIATFESHNSWKKIANKVSS